MALFLDTFVNKLDRKGRVSVPAAYRQQLASQPFQGIAALPSYKHPAIHCGDLAWFAEISKALEAVDLLSDEHDDLTAAMFAETKQLPFDGEGRIILPPVLIERAAIKDLAAFVGRGATFEIWEPAALDAYKIEARRRALEKGRTLTRRPGGEGK
jgi:transcriptional regulator MraZ